MIVYTIAAMVPTTQMVSALNVQKALTAQLTVTTLANLRSAQQVLTVQDLVLLPLLFAHLVIIVLKVARQ